MTRISLQSSEIREMLLRAIVSTAGLFALLAAGAVFPASPGDSLGACQGEAFENSYFLLEPADFYKASVFYLQLPDQNAPTDGGLKNLAGERVRLKTFYDDQSHSLLDNGLELASSVITSLPAHQEERDGITLVDHAFTPAQQINYEVRRYKRKTTALDKHPLFSRIKRSERPLLIEYLKSRAGVQDPEQVQARLTVEEQESIRLYRYFGVAYGSISMTAIHINSYGMENSFMALKFEIFPDSVENLNSQELAHLSDVLCRSQLAFATHHPELQALPWLGYSHYYHLAEKLLPNRALFDRYPLLYRLGQVFSLLFIGFLVMYLAIGRYRQTDKHRRLTRTQK